MLLKYTLSLVLVVLSICSLILESTGMQYPFAIGIVLLGFVAFFGTKINDIYFIDLGWMICLVVCFFYVLESTVNEKPLKYIGWQGLMFFIPISQYIASNLKYSFTEAAVSRIVLYCCLMKLPVFIIYYEEVVSSILAQSERVRFHDFFSISLVFIIFPILLYFKSIEVKYKVVFSAFLALFVITAAHRSAFLALAVQFGFWLLYSSDVSRPFKFRVVMGFFSIAVLYLLFTSSGQVMIDLFSASLSGGDGNTNARLGLYYLVLNDWFEFPFGHGLGEAYAYGESTMGDKVYYALHHNSYLTPLYYLGIFPAMFFVASMFWLMVKPIKGAVSTLYFRSVITGMCVFAVLNLWFEHPIYALSFWLVFGLLKASMKSDLVNIK
ncbi:O-antigen ligase family protein [Marinobacterium jannaschii]|uniref:O-antigen ligase family protein n=1 Tax=Marinobacterium jannaschii TaxID=64970 RepID=UPI0004835E2D|nr:hypothetical protein [Marinobacterium jannaschii]